MKTVVITDHVFPNNDPERAVLEGIADIRLADPGDDAALIAQLKGADAVLNCYRPLSSEVVSSLERCRIIARYGIGVDTIPLRAAAARGVQVTNVPDYCIEEVADHAMAMALALTRGVVKGLDQTRAGGWSVKELRPLRRLRGRTLAAIGFGRIARAVADRARAFGYEVAAHDPFTDDAAIAAAGARPVTLDDAFAQADLLSLHAPLTDATRHLVNADRLATMRPDAVIVNTARGGLVDYEAVAAALQAGRLGGAGLDVLESEPPAPGATPPAQVPNLIVTPHLAFYSEEALVELQRKAAEQVRAVLLGERPAYPVPMPAAPVAA